MTKTWPEFSPIGDIKDLPQNVGVYCRKCLKPYINCLCRKHDWMAIKEYVEAEG